MNHHILEVLAGLLEPNEREAVLGDLAESNKSWARSLRDLLGLVGRRQGQAWMQANSWIVLLLLVLPIGSFLTQSSRSIADSSALHLWMLASNWSAARQGDPAYWDAVAVNAPRAMFSLLVLACWTWTLGFAISSFARRAAPVSAAIFVLFLVWTMFAAEPRFGVGAPILRRFGEWSGDDGFQITLYRIVLPILVQLFLERVS